MTDAVSWGLDSLSFISIVVVWLSTALRYSSNAERYIKSNHDNMKLAIQIV